MMEMIGHLSKNNKETYLKHAQPLQKYIDAKKKLRRGRNRKECRNEQRNIMHRILTTFSGFCVPLCSFLFLQKT